MPARILLVDDDANLLAGLRRKLHRHFELVTALGGAEALATLERDAGFAVIVADMQMPGMNGVELLETLRARCPDTVRVMLTGNADQGTAMQAINRGAVFRFLTKPCDTDQMVAVLTDAARQHELLTAEKVLLQQTLRGSVKLLVDLLGLVDPAAHARAAKLRQWASALCEPLEVERPWEVEIAAMLSPLAFAALPAVVREKLDAPSRLSPVEKQQIAAAQAALAGMVGNLPRLEGVADVLRHVTTRFDGGNVAGSLVKGSRLPMGARLLHALYDLAELEQQGLSIAAAADVLTRQRGKHDPAVLEAIDRWVTTPAERVPAAVAVRDLLVGAVVAADVRDADGRLLLGKDQAITEAVRTALSHYHALGQLAEPVMIYALRAAEAPARRPAA